MQTFAFTIEEVGWGLVTVRAGIFSVNLSVSYLTDAVGDMLGAFLEVATGGGNVWLTLSDEPGQYAIHVSPVEGDPQVCNLRFFFSEGSALVPSERRYLGELRIKQQRLLLSVVAAFGALRDRGDEFYEKMWPEYEFPHGTLRQLELVMASR